MFQTRLWPVHIPKPHLARSVPVRSYSTHTTGVITVAAGTSASLRFLTLTDLGPFARQDSIVQSDDGSSTGNTTAPAYPFDSTIPDDPCMVLGTYTSLLWCV